MKQSAECFSTIFVCQHRALFTVDGICIALDCSFREVLVKIIAFETANW